jgi:hypothetical protein
VRFYVDADRDVAFAGSVTGGVVVSIAFLDFSDEAKCRNAAAGLVDSFLQELARRVACICPNH